LPEDYPQTAQAAAQSLLDFFSRGDSNQFFTYFGQPGGRAMYDQIFANQRAKDLIGSKVIQIGEAATNGIIPDILFVPYKIQLQDGSEKELQLRLVQDPNTLRWYFKGGI
jgi:hypothetical protein